MDKNDFLDAMLNRKAIEGLCNSSIPGEPQKWRLLDDSDSFAIMATNPGLLRVRPTLKPVDMSVLIGSGIDCEFSDGDNWRPWSSLLGKIEGGRFFPQHSGFQAFGTCRPRQDYWHSLLNCSKMLCSQLASAGFDITKDCEHYSVLIHGTADDYCYPWAVE